MGDIALNSSAPFERERKPFRALNREFHYEFIPSIHFQDVLQQILELLLETDFLNAVQSVEAPENGTVPHADIPPLSRSQQPLLAKLQALFSEKIYRILFDVLLYQNDQRVDMERLKHQTSPLEIASFLSLLLTDEEVLNALGVVTSGLGKLLAKLLPTPSATPNSTPSS